MIPLAYEALGNILKGSLPNIKKKKKDASPLLDEIIATIINPLKLSLKDVSSRFSTLNHPPFDVQTRQDHWLSGIAGGQLEGRVAEIASKRALEIAKEEKLAFDRCKEWRQNAGKRFKEVTGNGVFSN